MESQVSGHQYLTIRERLAEKLEAIRWDPYSKRPIYYFRATSILRSPVCKTNGDRPNTPKRRIARLTNRECLFCRLVISRKQLNWSLNDILSICYEIESFSISFSVLFSSVQKDSVYRERLKVKSLRSSKRSNWKTKIAAFMKSVWWKTIKMRRHYKNVV